MKLKSILTTGLLIFYSVTTTLCVEEKEIVIVIASYKNEAWYERNLNSVANQEYQNYRIIYINDCSPDNTGALVDQYIKNHHLEHKITLINNSVRVGALANFYRAIHSCSDSTIIVMVDGDDWLNGPHVLSRINTAYANPNTWLTYGQFQEYPKEKTGFCRTIPSDVTANNLFRESTWLTSHPRTFYAALFKKIKLEDLLYEGKLFPVTWDLAIMFPMLEMAREHIEFIPDILYIYNEDNPCNDFKTSLLQQLHCDYLLRGGKKYERLSTLFTPRTNDHIGTVILSDNPTHLQATLQSMITNIIDMKNGVIIFNAHNETDAQHYTDLQKNYPTMLFIPQQKDLTTLLRAVLTIQKENTYVLITNDHCTITRPINLHDCAHQLTATNAYGFYLALGKNRSTIPGLQRDVLMPPLANIWNTTYAWRFSEGEYLWQTQHSCFMALYRTHDLLKKITETDEETPWIGNPWNLFDDERAIGLCFEQAPVEIVNE